MADDQYARLSAAVSDGTKTDAVRILVSDVVTLNDDEQALFSVPPDAVRHLTERLDDARVVEIAGTATWVL